MLSPCELQLKAQNGDMIHTTGRGAAASGHRMTTQAALDIMAQGGNAFDGAIAAAFMACVCEPVLASPGGGGFAMVHEAQEGVGRGETRLVDFFAQTPIEKTQANIDFVEVEADFGKVRQTFHIGQASTATPGFVAGILKLFDQHASMPLKQLVQPAQKAARQGVEVSPFQQYLSEVVSPILLHSRQSRTVFAPGGRLRKAGETLRNEGLADFFEQLVKHGRQGMPVDKILAAQKDGGHLVRRDFEDYQVVIRDSLAVDVGGARVHLNPLPAAGGVLVALAFAALQGHRPGDVARALHHVDISRREADNDLTELHQKLGPPAHRGTTHISVVDGAGNACSMTLSNGEGNGYMVDGCGFMMNNMLGEADINPGGKLGWPSDTRMSSMMCPTIVEHQDGSITALGSGGSNRIRSAIFQVLVQLLLNHQNAGQSVAAPRLHVEAGHLDFEPPARWEVAQQLSRLFPNHRQWAEKNMFFGGCHVAGLSADSVFCGAGDERRHGFFAQI